MFNPGKRSLPITSSAFLFLAYLLLAGIASAGPSITLAKKSGSPASKERPFWSQWGRNSQHTGMVNIPAQPLHHKLADIVYDEFVEQEKAEFGALGAHYQATLIDGDSFYMVRKDGAKYPSCHPHFSWFNGVECGAMLSREHSDQSCG